MINLFCNSKVRECIKRFICDLCTGGIIYDDNDVSVAKFCYLDIPAKGYTSVIFCVQFKHNLMLKKSSFFVHIAFWGELIFAMSVIYDYD